MFFIESRAGPITGIFLIHAYSVKATPSMTMKAITLGTENSALIAENILFIDLLSFE